MDDRKKLAYTLEATALYYGRKIEQQVLTMMIDDLIDLPVEQILEAYTMYRRNPKNRAMPLPAQIRDIVAPAANPESAAREAAAKITQAITRFGYSNPGPAKEFLGDATWSVIQTFGGWNFICTSHGVTIDPSVFHAQVRDRLSDVHREGKTFRHLSLASSEHGEMLEQSNLDKERARQIQEFMNKGGI